MIEPTLMFGIITAGGTLVTIAVVVWNNGKRMGTLTGQITALQADVTRQNGNTDTLFKQVGDKVSKPDCDRTHDGLIRTISEINTHLLELHTQREQSEIRILSAIQALGRRAP